MHLQSSRRWRRYILLAALTGLGAMPIARGLLADDAPAPKEEAAKPEGENKEGQTDAPAPEENAEPADPEMAALEKQDGELEQRTKDLSEKWKSTEDASERESIKNQLLTAANELFDIRHKRREHEIANLEKEVEQLRKELKRRNELREQIVARYLGDLLGEDLGL